MSYRRKSCQEKLADKKGLPKTLKLKKSFLCYNAMHKMGAEAGVRWFLSIPARLLRS